MASDATIAKFKKVLKDELGKEVTDREAHNMLNAYVQFFTMLANFDREDVT